MGPKAKDRDRAGDQHLARENALTLLYPRDVAHRLNLVLARPTLGRKERVQAVGVGSRIGVGYDLTTFLVIGGVGDPPLDLVGCKWNFKLRKNLVHHESRGRSCCVLSRHGESALLQRLRRFVGLRGVRRVKLILQGLAYRMGFGRPPVDERGSFVNHPSRPAVPNFIHRMSERSAHVRFADYTSNWFDAKYL